MIKTGYAELDVALGAGAPTGYPASCVVEIVGADSKITHTLALRAIAECQRAGGSCAYIDGEQTLSLDGMRALGVDPAKLIVSQPDTEHQALEILEALVKDHHTHLVVVDVEALTSHEPGEPGLESRIASGALRKLTAVAHRTGTTVMFLRRAVAQYDSYSAVPPWGNALKYYASLRLDVRRIGPDRVRVKVMKNKLARPFESAELVIPGDETHRLWGKVYLLWQNDGVLGVYATEAGAQAAAAQRRAELTAVPWGGSDTGRRWWQEGGPIARLEIDVRDVRSAEK